MGATAILAEFAASTSYDQLPPAALAVAREHLLDCFGVALAAAVEPAGRIIAEVTREAGGRPEAHLLGSGLATSAGQAAWANGALAHLLDFDDTGPSHPTASILPAALAIGERLQASGRDLLTAMAVGYETFERLSAAARPYESRLRGRGYHPTSIYGCPAAAAAAGNLLGLDPERLNAAIALASSNAGGLTQHFGNWGKGVQAGNAARAGVVGALLAASGYRADDAILEGQFGLFNAIHGAGNYDLSGLGERLGQEWRFLVPGPAIKRYPSCGGTLRALDATLALRAEHDLTIEQVESVVVEIAPELLETVRFRRPTDGFQGKFSLDYCVAAAILDGRVDQDSFDDSYASSPRFRAALDKVELVEHPEWSADWRSHRRSPVTLHLMDGRSLNREVDHPRGSRENPLDRAELLDKFRACARRALAPEQIEAAIAALDNLDQLANLTDLTATLSSAAVVVG